MAKTSIWQRIKNFFMGKSSSTPQKKRQTVTRQPSAHSSRTASVGSQYAYRGGGAYQPSRKEQKKLEPKRTVYKADNDTQRYKRIDDVLNQQKQQKKLKQTYEHMTGDDKRTTAQKKLAQKMQLNDRVQADAKFSAKYQPKRYAVTKGLTRGATLGLNDLATKNGSKGVKQADKYYEKHKGKTEKILETGGDIAGTALSFGASSGLSKKALGKTVKATDKLTKGMASKTGRAVEKKLVEKLGEKGGKKIAKSLADDFAMNTFAGNTYLLNEALSEDGSAKDKAKSLAKNVAMNYAVGGGLTGAQAVKPLLKNLKFNGNASKLAKKVAKIGSEEAEKIADTVSEKATEKATRTVSKEVEELRLQLQNEKEHKKLLQQMPNGRRKQKALQESNNIIRDIQGKIKTASNPVQATSENVEVLAKNVPENVPQNVSKNVSENANVPEVATQSVSQPTETFMPEPKAPRYKVTRADRKLATKKDAPISSNVGYHAGYFDNPSKANPYGKLAGKGTHGYGTGTYIVGDKDAVIEGFSKGKYGKRPLYEIDFDKYNLYKPKNYTQGKGLKDGLGTINAYMDDYLKGRNYDFDAIRNDVSNGNYESFKKFLKDDDFPVDTFKADARKQRDMLASRTDDYYLERARESRELDEAMDGLKPASDKVNLKKDKALAKVLKAKDQEWLNKFDEEREAMQTISKHIGTITKRYERSQELRKSDLEKLAKFFPDKTPEEILNAFDKTVAEVERYGRENIDKNTVDSASTLFMKNLGYEGVDVRGIDLLDNTTNGSVIYDVDKNRIKKVHDEIRAIPKLENKRPLNTAEESIQAERVANNTPEIVDTKQANREKLKPMSAGEQAMRDVEARMNENNFSTGAEFGEESGRMTGLEGNSKQYEATETMKSNIKNTARNQPKTINGYNNVHEFIDDYANSRKVLTDNEIKSMSFNGEDVKTGGLSDDVNASLKNLQKALNGNDEQAIATARAEFERSIKDVQGCEIFTKEQLFDRSKPINVKVANINELPEDVVRATDYIKTKDFDEFEKKIAKENVKLEAQGKRIRNSYATAESMTASDMARTLMERMKGKYIYNVEGNLKNVEESCERVFKNGNPTDKLNELARMTRAGELPLKQKDLLKNMYDAQVLREYCNMYMSQVPEEMAQGFREGYAIAQEYIANSGTFCGQVSQSQACFRAMSPSVKAIKTERQIRDYFRELGLDNWDKVKEQVPMFDELFETIRTGSPEESQKAITKALDLSREVSPRSFADFINQWRYLAMLGNAKTHGRNCLGNAIMFGKSLIDDSLAGVIQDLARDSSLTRNVKEPKIKPPKAGVEAVEHLSAKATTKSKSVLADTYDVLFNKKTSKVAQNAQKALDEDIDSLMHGTEKYVENLNISKVRLNKNYELKSTKPLARGVDRLSKINSGALEAEDKIFIKLNYKKAYAEYCATNGFKNASESVQEEISNKAREYAKKEALEMTYRDYNSVAQMLNNFSTKANRKGAPTSYKAGNFMLKAVMPFTTTPMNVTKQSLKSSPIGLLVSTKRLYNAVKVGDMDAINKNLADLSKGITGTGIMAIGMWLGTKDRDSDGYLTTDAGDDVISKYYKQLGYQNYSIKLRNGTYTIDWATPLSTTLFVGAEIGKNLRNTAENLGETNTKYDDVANLTRVCARFVSPIMQLTMLQGVQTVLDQATADSTVDSITNVLSAIAGNYVGSLTPTAVKQIGRTIQPYDYMSVNRSQQGIASQMEYNVKNNTPIVVIDAIKDAMAQAGIGEGSERGADTDINGNIKGLKTSGKDYAKSLFMNTLSPGYYSKIIKDSNDEELIRVAQALQEEDGNDDRAKYALNRKSYNTELKVGTSGYQKVMQLSDKDISDYNQAKQRSGYFAMKGVLESKPFNRTGVRMSEEKKQELLDNAPATLKDAQKWLFEQDVYKNASPTDKYAMIQAMSGGNKKNKTTGWVRQGGIEAYEKKGKNVWNYIYDSDLTKSNKKKLQSAIDSGLITEELAARYYVLAGHDSYSDSEDEDYNGQHTYRFYKVDKLKAFNILEEEGYKLNEEQKAALYNAWLYGRASKYYTGMSAGGSGSRRGYRRRGYRHYGHSSSGRRGSAASPIKASDYKVTNTARAKVNSSVFENPTSNSKSSKTKSKVTDAYIKKILKQVKE